MRSVLSSRVPANPRITQSLCCCRVQQAFFFRGAAGIIPGCSTCYYKHRKKKRFTKELCQAPPLVLKEAKGGDSHVSPRPPVPTARMHFASPVLRGCSTRLRTPMPLGSANLSDIQLSGSGVRLWHRKTQQFPGFQQGPIQECEVQTVSN